MLILKNGDVIVGNGSVLEQHDVRIDGDRIVEIGRHIHATSGDQVVDVSGKTVMPGFIDAHVHLLFNGEIDTYQGLQQSDTYLAIRAAQNARKSLEAGFTTLRDVGARSFIDVDVRNAINSGIIPGPRLLVSGHIISITGGHGSFIPSREADGPEECRKAVREQIKGGADWIKVAATGGVLTRGSDPGRAEFTEEELRAIVEEAHRANRKVAAHCHGAEGIKNAVRAGVDTIEHGTYADDEALELMLRNGTALVSTIKSSADLNSEQARSSGVPAQVLEKSAHAYKHQKEMFQRAHKKGVKIILGTDSGTPLCYHGQNGEEFAYLVANGMTPMEAIKAGTGDAAEVLGIGKEVGTVEEGKMADIVVVDGDPLEDIAILGKVGRIKMVIKGGHIVFRRDQ